MLEVRPVVFVILAIFHLSLSSTTPSDWEIAVSLDKQLDLLSINGSYVSHIQCSPTRGLTYDYLRNNLYLVNENSQLNQVQVSRKGLFKSLKQIGDVDSSGAIIAVDSATNTIYWTDYVHHTIHYGSLNITSGMVESQIFIKLNTWRPTDVTIDPCRRILFWASNDEYTSQIAMSSLDEPQSQEVLIADTDSIVNSLYYAQEINALLWSEQKKRVYNIKMLSLSDSVTTVVYSTSLNEGPFSIATLNGYIFWLDRKGGNIWKKAFNRTQTSSLTRELVTSYNNPRSRPTSILIVPNQIYHPGKCDTPEIIHHSDQVFWNQSGVCLNGKFVNSSCICFAGYTGEHCGVPDCHSYCLNEGNCTLPSSKFERPTCSCPTSHRGERCEIEVCTSSYCLNEGSCSVSEFGEPRCTCRSGFTGLRCESSYCPRDYCLNGGTCDSSKEGILNCSCRSGFLGPRCEYSLSHCHYLCSMDEESDFQLICGCSPKPMKRFWSSDPEQIRLIALVLQGCLILLLVVVCIVLIRRVVVLGKRPRLKKRFTGASQPKLPEQCEIAIENCCNMNICETPCYEPEFRTPFSSGKKEEKRELLKNMVGEHSSS